MGVDPTAVDQQREIDRLPQKVEAGAEFAITQPVFDPEALLRFLDQVETYRRTIPILAGIWPLVSFKNAEFMKNEVPGVVVPKAILERMSRCRTREDGRKAGIEIARGIVERISDRVNGLPGERPDGARRDGAGGSRKIILKFSPLLLTIPSRGEVHCNLWKRPG